MSSIKFGSKEFIMKIMENEKTRESKVKELKNELRELEKKEEMCDVKRIIEIVDELNIIDPLDEYEEKETPKQYSHAPEVKKRFIPLKVSAVAVIVTLVFIQIISVTASNDNFWGSVIDYTKEMIVSLMGKKIRQDDFSVSGTKTHVYKDIDEFKKAENINIFIPESIQGNVLTEIDFSFESRKDISVYYGNEYTLTINLNESDTDKYFDTENDVVYSNNNIDYYIKYVNKEYTSITWILDNDLYRVSCDFSIKNYIEVINDLLQ